MVDAEIHHCICNCGDRGLRIAIPPACPRKGGVSEGVSDGVSPGPFGPRAPECPKRVPRVSPECPGHLFDTPGTRFGHSGARSPKGPGTPRRTLPRTPPIFGDTLGDTPGTLRARRAQETPVAGRQDRKLRITLLMQRQI